MGRIHVLSIAAVLFLGEVFGAVLPSASEIEGWPMHHSRELIYATGFEPPYDPAIQLGPGFRYARGEGNNANTALRVDRTIDIHRTQDTYIQLPDKIKPGYQYRVMVSVKGKGVRHDRRPVPPGSHRFMETFYTAKEKGGGSFANERIVPFAKPPAGEVFQEFSYTFPGIKGARASLRLALWIDFHGTIWFDDLRVFREGIKANAFLIQPACATFFQDSGEFLIRISLPEVSEKHLGLVELKQKGKLLGRKVIASRDSWLEGDFGAGLPVGKAELNITLADRGKKQRIKVIRLPVTIRSEKRPPAGAAVFDRHGRMLLDGKPVLPIGVFYGSLPHQREENLKKIADSDFNFMTDYSALSMALPQDQEKITAILKGLDQMQKYGIKNLFCLTPFYSAGSAYLRKGWSGEKETLGMTRKLVKAIRNHPALLGYYLTDELSEGLLAVPIAMRNILNHHDPYHPTFTLTNLPSAMPDYAVSGDAMMYDPYPIDSVRRGRRGVENALRPFGESAAAAGCPVWAVPQGFNWGISKVIRHNNPGVLENFIDPTEDDMRSMALLAAIDGVKGFCFYVYPFPWQKEIQAKYAANGLADYPEKMWRKLKKTASALRSLEPFILSLEKAQAVTVKNQGKANTRARLWKTAAGRFCLVIAGCGGNASNAVITLPSGCPPLKSRFGHTVPLGNGRYHYQSADLNSDILME